MPDSGWGWGGSGDAAAGGGGSGGGGAGGGVSPNAHELVVDVDPKRAARKMARAKRKGRPGKTHRPHHL